MPELKLLKVVKNWPRSRCRDSRSYTFETQRRS